MLLPPNDMSSPTSWPAPSQRGPSLRSRLLAFAAPERLSEPFVQAQFALELSRNEQLQLEPDGRKAEAFAAFRQVTIERLRRLRRGVRVSLVSIASALLAAYFFRFTAVAPMLPRPVLVVGAIFSLAVATLAYLGWGRKPRHREATVPVSGPRLYHVLYWIGVCWAALAIF